LFGIGSWEFIVIVVLAMLLFGPDKLPQFARTLGRFMRDIKRYQDLMQSAVRAEMFASDDSGAKDPFKTGKDFREKVAGGGFSKPTSAAAEPTDEDAEQPAGEGVAEDAPAASDDASADTADEGEGERDEA
jgi:sec-independent protein translocase protein TatB